MEEEKKEEQKRFKVLKRTDYENEMDYENKKITLATMGTALTAFCAIHLISKGSIEDFAYWPFGIADLGYSIYLLKKLIEAIVRKTNLKIKVEDIDRELEMLENAKKDISEESRGMSK